MEELVFTNDTSRRRSSILKQPKSTKSIGEDVASDMQEEAKQLRQSKRVSFADICQIQEFCKENLDLCVTHDDSNESPSSVNVLAPLSLSHVPPLPKMPLPMLNNEVTFIPLASTDQNSDENLSSGRMCQRKRKPLSVLSPSQVCNVGNDDVFYHMSVMDETFIDEVFTSGDDCNTSFTMDCSNNELANAINLNQKRFHGQKTIIFSSGKNGMDFDEVEDFSVCFHHKQPKSVAEFKTTESPKSWCPFSSAELTYSDPLCKKIDNSKSNSDQLILNATAISSSVDMELTKVEDFAIMVTDCCHNSQSYNLDRKFISGQIIEGCEKVATANCATDAIQENFLVSKNGESSLHYSHGIPIRNPSLASKILEVGKFSVDLQESQEAINSNSGVDMELTKVEDHTIILANAYQGEPLSISEISQTKFPRVAAEELHVVHEMIRKTSSVNLDYIDNDLDSIQSTEEPFLKCSAIDQIVEGSGKLTTADCITDNIHKCHFITKNDQASLQCNQVIHVPNSSVASKMSEANKFSVDSQEPQEAFNFNSGVDMELTKGEDNEIILGVACHGKSSFISEISQPSCPKAVTEELHVVQEMAGETSSANLVDIDNVLDCIQSTEEPFFKCSTIGQIVESSEKVTITNCVADNICENFFISKNDQSSFQCNEDTHVRNHCVASNVLEANEFSADSQEPQEAFNFNSDVDMELTKGEDNEIILGVACPDRSSFISEISRTSCPKVVTEELHMVQEMAEETSSANLAHVDNVLDNMQAIEEPFFKCSIIGQIVESSEKVTVTNCVADNICEHFLISKNDQSSLQCNEDIHVQTQCVASNVLEANEFSADVPFVKESIDTPQMWMHISQRTQGINTELYNSGPFRYALIIKDDENHTELHEDCFERILNEEEDLTNIKNPSHDEPHITSEKLTKLPNEECTVLLPVMDEQSSSQNMEPMEVCFSSLDKQSPAVNNEQNDNIEIANAYANIRKCRSDDSWQTPVEKAMNTPAENLWDITYPGLVQSSFDSAMRYLSFTKSSSFREFKDSDFSLNIYPNLNLIERQLIHKDQPPVIQFEHVDSNNIMDGPLKIVKEATRPVVILSRSANIDSSPTQGLQTHLPQYLEFCEKQQLLLDEKSNLSLNSFPVNSGHGKKASAEPFVDYMAVVTYSGTSPAVRQQPATFVAKHDQLLPVHVNNQQQSAAFAKHDLKLQSELCCQQQAVEKLQLVQHNTVPLLSTMHQAQQCCATQKSDTKEEVAGLCVGKACTATKSAASSYSVLADLIARAKVQPKRLNIEVEPSREFLLIKNGSSHLNPKNDRLDNLSASENRFHQLDMVVKQANQLLCDVSALEERFHIITEKLACSTIEIDKLGVTSVYKEKIKPQPPQLLSNYRIKENSSSAIHLSFWEDVLHLKFTLENIPDNSITSECGTTANHKILDCCQWSELKNDTSKVSFCPIRKFAHEVMWAEFDKLDISKFCQNTDDLQKMLPDMVSLSDKAQMLYRDMKKASFCYLFSISGHNFSIEFNSLTAALNFTLTFTLELGKYPNDLRPPRFQCAIGDISEEEVLDALRYIAPGPEYLLSTVSAIEKWLKAKELSAIATASI